MLDTAFFADDTPQERTITLADGSEHVLKFRQISHGVIRHLGLVKDEPGIYAEHRFVAACLLNGDGTLALTPEQASNIKPMVFTQILKVCQEINGIGQESEQGKD